MNLLPIPDNVTDEQALYLSDVLPTSYHTVVDTGVKEGDVVGVWVRIQIGRTTSTTNVDGRVWVRLANALLNGLN